MKTNTLATPLTPAFLPSFGALFLCAALCAASPAWATGLGFSDVTKNVGNNVRHSVPLIPMLSYVVGVFFTAAGLLKLKDWVNDGERNSIVPALIRLVVATFLILLPHMIRLTTGTFFRRDNGDMFVNITAPPPRLGAFCKSNDANCN